MPSPRRHQPHAVVPQAGLARAALSAVLAGDDLGVGRRLVVIVAPQGDRLLADLGGDVHDADGLARRLAAAEAQATQERLRDELLAGGRLAIAGVDRVDRPDRQRVIARFLDVIVDRGLAACVSLGVPPAAAALDPLLESRLAAGLVVLIPSAPEHHPAAAAGHTSLPAVIRATARLHGISVASLVGQSRQRSLVRSRSIAMYVARTCTAASLDAIGEAFGGRDHTTAMRSIRSVERLLAGDPSLAGDVRDVVAALQPGSGRSRRA